MSTRIVLTLVYAFKGISEVGGDNVGQMVEVFQRFVGIPAGSPWCAAFASYIGWHGCLDYATGRSYWPVPLTGGCQVMADWALAQGVITTTPKPGNLALIWHPELSRFAHVTWLVDQEGPAWRCVEGNSNLDGSRNGWGVVERTKEHARVFHDRDRFVNWQALLPQTRLP